MGFRGTFRSTLLNLSKRRRLRRVEWHIPLKNSLSPCLSILNLIDFYRFRKVERDDSGKRKRTGYS